MATSNTYNLSSENFKMPSEPCPLPSLGSDEESFVVLWKDMDNKSPSEDLNEPVGTSVVEEAKQLIKKELSQIEQSQNTLTSSQDGKSLTQNGSVKVETVESDSQNVQASSNMEQSTVLPTMPQVNRGFDTANVISITTFSNDWTSEEVQKKIAQIIEENIRLKDTILQNNMSMKSQYERIVAWQEDVQRVHQAHKEKIIEAKDFIERLKSENHNMARDLEKVRDIKDLQEAELNTLREALRENEQRITEKLAKSTESNMKEFELEISNKKIKELELAVENMNLENRNLKDDKNKLVKDATKIEAYEKEIERLQELLHTSKMQIEEGKMELLKLKSLEEEKQRGMNNIVENLRAQLYTAHQQAVPVEELTNTRQQLVNIQIVLTQVEQSRAAAYAKIEALNNELSEVREQLQSVQSQKDEMYALQTQLDLYKADFEAEREAKEAMRLESNKYSEDMQNLQRRNQQLQEEIEMIRENRDYVVYPNRRPTAPHQSPASSSSNDHSMKCPKCDFGFNTIQSLQNHVYRCIDLDDHLP